MARGRTCTHKYKTQGEMSAKSSHQFFLEQYRKQQILAFAISGEKGFCSFFPLDIFSFPL